MSKTTTISARVPVDVANMLKHSCNKNGVSMSKYLTHIVTTPNANSVSSEGLLIDKTELPSEIKTVLSTLGGAGIGLLVYKLVKAYMPKDEFEEGVIESVAVLCAFASGIGSVVAIDKLIRK